MKLRQWHRPSTYKMLNRFKLISYHNTFHKVTIFQVCLALHKMKTLLIEIAKIPVLNVLQHNFPAFCRYDNKWFSRKWQNYGLFPTETIIIIIFFLYHEIHFHCRDIWQGHQILVLLLRNLNGCKLVGTSWGNDCRSLNAQYTSNPLGLLLGYMKLQCEKIW